MVGLMEYYCDLGGILVLWVDGSYVQKGLGMRRTFA